MSNFYNFIDRAEWYECEGKVDELLVVYRRGKTQSPTVMENEKQCAFQPDSNYVSGDLVINKNSRDAFFIIAKQYSTESTQGQLRKSNALINIAKITKKYVNGIENGYAETITLTNVPSYMTQINANMRQYDAGLLPKTVVKFITKEIAIALTDRIKFDGKNYQVDDINASKYPNLYEIQCSLDTTRKTL
jgi:hypothetical protein